MKIQTGPWISGVVALAAVVGLGAAFVGNASPYVTVAQAASTRGESLHLAGDLVKGSLVNDLKGGTLRFKVMDIEGHEADVVYNGSPVSNLSEATQVVVVGFMRDGKFRAHKMLVKCPSRYEGDKKAT